MEVNYRKTANFTIQLQNMTIRSKITKIEEKYDMIKLKLMEKYKIIKANYIR